MDILALVLAALVVLAAAALAVWSWTTMAQADDDLRSLVGLDHFDV